MSLLGRVRRGILLSEIETVRGASCAVHGFQFFFVIEIARVIIIFSALRAFFDAGAAFDADAGHLADSLRIDRPHWTDRRAETALVAGNACQRFHLADIDKNAMAVTRLIVACFCVSVNSNRSGQGVKCR